MKTVLLLLIAIAVGGWAVNKTVGYMDQATEVMEGVTAQHGCG